MFRAGEDADKSPEHEFEPALRLLGWKLHECRLFTDDEFQFRDEADDKLRIRAKRLQKGLAPNRQFSVAFAKKSSHETSKSLHQCRIGNIAFVLVEFA